MKVEVQDFLYKKNRQQQIKGFYYVARYRSVSEAAKVMNLTQSTVSLQLQSLERDLGFKLLKRGTKPLILTEDGEEFYRIACPLMHEFESVVEKFLNLKNEKKCKKIDIAVHHIAISYLMPKVVSEFKKICPDVGIIIRNISHADAIERLKNGEIDLAFYPNVKESSEIKLTEVISYDPILIVNKNHPAAKHKLESLSDLKKFDLIRIDRNLITLPLFEEALKNYGIKGSIEFENGNWEMLKYFVKQDNLAAVVSSICIDNNDDDLVIKNLANFFPKMSYSICLKNGALKKKIIETFYKVIIVVIARGLLQ